MARPFLQLNHERWSSITSLYIFKHTPHDLRPPVTPRANTELRRSKSELKHARGSACECVSSPDPVPLAAFPRTSVSAVGRTWSDCRGVCEVRGCTGTRQGPSTGAICNESVSVSSELCISSVIFCVSLNLSLAPRTECPICQSE